MARIKGPLQIEGGMGSMSFYNRRGSDKIIVRTKGGASKQVIKNSPKFENFRLQQEEWKGCTAFASRLRYAFGGLHRVADYNLTPALNAFAKNLQKTDEISETGKRNIRFSAFRFTLDGFSFNRNYPFNTVLRVAPVVEIKREKLSAVVSVPRINTGVDLLNIQKLPYFRLTVSIGAVSDLVHDGLSNSYPAANQRLHGLCSTHETGWFPSTGIYPETGLEVQLPENMMPYLTDEITLVVSMAIEFGQVGFTGLPQEVKYAGCGKVLVCG